MTLSSPTAIDSDAEVTRVSNAGLHVERHRVVAPTETECEALVTREFTGQAVGKGVVAIETQEDDSLDADEISSDNAAATSPATAATTVAVIAAVAAVAPVTSIAATSA